MTKSIKAILFDLDGTLLDTERLSDKALLLALFGTSPLPSSVLNESPMTSEYLLPWDLKRQLLGLRGAEWAPIALDYARTHWDAVSIHDDDDQLHQQHRQPYPTATQLWTVWEEHLNNLCHDVEACPGACELVQALANVSSSSSSSCSLPMAIATSSRYAGVQKKKVRHQDSIFQYIDVIVAGDDPSIIQGKPAPDIYLEAAKRLNVPPSDCLVFEDALSGVRSGKAAGCTVVAIPDPRFTEDELATFVRAGADVIIPSLWNFDGRPFNVDVNMNDLNPANKHKCG
jgi:beta-phosphoglucomutase-like phosphatase (HAD superfamily)